MYQVTCDCSNVSELISGRSQAEQRAIELVAQFNCPCHVTSGVDPVLTVAPRNGGTGAIPNSASEPSSTPFYEEYYRQHPVSTYAINAALGGEQGAWKRVAVLTALRSAMMLPGLWLAGIRGWRLFGAAFLASTTMTGALIGYYALNRSTVDAAREGLQR